MAEHRVQAEPKNATEPKQAEPKSADLAAAVSGAQAVADAVKRVADAAVAAAQQGAVSGRDGDFSFSGTPGGRFTIRGEGFGPSGIVKVGGVQAHARMWSTRWIEGELPAGVGYGPVEVHVDDATVRRGHFRAGVV